FNLYKDNIIQLLRLKEYAESFIEEVENNLERVIMEKLNMKDFNNLYNWAEGQHEFSKKNNELIKAILITEHGVKWVPVFVENFSGVRIDDWSDKTYEKFLIDLQQNYHDVINFNKIEESEGEEEVKDINEFITLEIGNKTKVISKVDFSVKTKTVYTNIDRIIRNAGRNIPKNEMEYMIYLLLEQYVE
ncbi:hypothetical protein V7083_16785, partial [Bacillus sp. JJ1764]